LQPRHGEECALGHRAGLLSPSSLTALPEPLNVALAAGALAWLRAGEPDLGTSARTLLKIMEHASITTTEIYSRLGHDLFAEKAFDAVMVDLSKPEGDVLSLRDVSGPNGHTMGTKQEANAVEQLA